MKTPESSAVRFQFGKNWQRFRTTIKEANIAEAEASLKTTLGLTHLREKRFLDIGSGSGLFSLAARRLGATVHSFDYDLDAVECTSGLRDTHRAGDPGWAVEQGSALDAAYIRSLGQFDIVYAWGVLHHTGEMWNALDNARLPVARDGKLYLSIYNDQGWPSRAWHRTKQLYNGLPPHLRFLVLWPATVRLWGPAMVKDAVRGTPFKTWREYAKGGRGMSPSRDLVDWVGGYPFEVAKPEQLFFFYKERGFALTWLKTCAGGRGCNEFVFTHIGDAAQSVVGRTASSQGQGSELPSPL